MHTFLFDEGVWRVEGETFDEGGARKTTGESRIVHWPGVWLIESKLHGALDAGEPVETSIEVSPVGGDEQHTTWTAFSSVLGKQRGHFVIIGDTILSIFDCVEGDRRGTEVVRRLDDDTYEQIGALFTGPTKVASWALRLTRRH